MNLYKITGSIRSFVLTHDSLSEQGYELVSDKIDDDSVLVPVISPGIYDAIGALPGEFLATGFSINMA